jgi:hypothetical protein
MATSKGPRRSGKSAPKSDIAQEFSLDLFQLLKHQFASYITHPNLTGAEQLILCIQRCIRRLSLTAFIVYACLSRELIKRIWCQFRS